MIVSLLGFAALIVLVGSGVMILLSWAFCVRPAPRELRILREVWLWALALRVLASDVSELDLTLYRDPTWLLLGISGLVMGWWNLRRVTRRDGDRCPQLTHTPAID